MLSKEFCLSKLEANHQVEQKKGPEPPPFSCKECSLPLNLAELLVNATLNLAVLCVCMLRLIFLSFFVIMALAKNS